jgi:purine-binding chemotaxis protein CheW
MEQNMNNLEPIDSNQILLFTLDEPRYALRLSAVERVIQAVEITPLPKAPKDVLGVINVQGQIISVIDIRPRLGLPPRGDINLGDHFILVRTPRQRMVLVADTVTDVRRLTENEFVAAENALTTAQYIHGMVKLEEGLILFCDLDQFLDPDEEQKLEDALKEQVAKSDNKTRQQTGKVK